MGTCFELILKMSLTASFVIAVVCLIRLLLLRAPRKYSYLLWLIVLIRLFCPAAPEMRFGLVPDMAGLLEKQQTGAEPVFGEDGFYAGASAYSTWMSSGRGEDGAGVGSEGTAPAHAASEIIEHPEAEAGLEEAEADSVPERTDAFLERRWEPGSVWNIIGCLWLCGCLIFLLIGAGGYVRVAGSLRRKEKREFLSEKTVVPKEKGVVRRHKMCVQIVEDEDIGTPFTAGVVRPVICLQKGLLPFQKEMVLRHEGVHIRRRDNLLKLLAYIARCVHWFNPLVWLAFRCFEEDMEISCDEAVLKQIGYERRKEYAKTLLALSECGRKTAFYPVSFGRVNAKMRIRNVLSKKKAGLWIGIISAAAVAVTAVVLLTDHRPVENVQELPQGIMADADAQEEEYLRRNQELVEQVVFQHQQELEAERQKLEDELAAQQELEAVQRKFEEELAEQQVVAALEEKMQLEQLCLVLKSGSVDEDEICLQDSDYYQLYEEQAHETVRLDGACALLCNPRTGLGSNAEAVVYTYPLDGIDGGSVMLSAQYGSRVHPLSGEVIFHSGLDFAAEKGTPVHAAAAACVYRTGFDAENGNYVILLHANGELTYYAHCESITVEEGDIVDRGEQIATVGNTGKSTGPHLHFAVSRDGKFLLPQFGNEGEFVPPDAFVILPVEVRTEY